jgi:hypothetical protein
MRQHRGPFTFLPVAVALSLVFSQLLAWTVLIRPVEASCNPGRSPANGTYQAGTVGVTNPYPIAVKADIEEYDPYVSGDSGIGTSMSVMLANGGTYWAQLGWNKHKAGSGYVREVFAEQIDGYGNNIWQTWSGRTVGTYTNYEITFDQSNHHYQYYVAGTEYQSIGASWTPNNFQIFSETQDKADQMPGGYNTHAVFKDTYIMQHGSPGWTSISGDTVHYYQSTARA